MRNALGLTAATHVVPHGCCVSSSGKSTHDNLRNHQGACKRGARDDGPAAADRRASSRRQLHDVGRFLDPEHRAASGRRGCRPRRQSSAVGNHGLRASGRRALASVRSARRSLWPSPHLSHRPFNPGGGVASRRRFDRAGSAPCRTGAARGGQRDGRAGGAVAADYNLRRRKTARLGVGLERIAALGRLHGRSNRRRDARRRAELALGLPDQRPRRLRHPCTYAGRGARGPFAPGRAARCSRRGIGNAWPLCHRVWHYPAVLTRTDQPDWSCWRCFFGSSAGQRRHWSRSRCWRGRRSDRAISRR